MRRASRAALLALLLVALPSAASAATPAAADDSGTSIHVVIPATTGVRVTNAELRWSLDAEAGGGAFAGGCNFLSAGAAGNAGGARVWTQADDLYAASAGHVRIEKPTASGAWALASWDDRCEGPDGAPVTPASTASTSGNQVVVDGGSGVVDLQAGTASVRWSGAFTVVFYGGMTYWSATDPVLAVSGGAGLLTATVSGYAADRADPSRWVPLAPRTVTLARLSEVTLGGAGFTATPDYLGVAVRVGVGTPQVPRDAANAAWWGAFPQDFVDFQQLTGQASYWYASGGSRDPAKVAAPLTVSWDARDAIEGPAAPPGRSPAGTPTNAVHPAPPGAHGAVPAGGPADSPGGDSDAGLVVAGSPATVVPASPLAIGGGPHGRPGDRRLLALAWGVVAALAAVAGLGLARGWLAVPGVAGAVDLRKARRKA